MRRSGEVAGAVERRTAHSAPLVTYYPSVLRDEENTNGSTTASAAGRHLSNLFLAQAIASVANLMLSLTLASALGPVGLGAYALFLAVGAALTLPMAWVAPASVVFGQAI